jgi:hypothetical protein
MANFSRESCVCLCLCVCMCVCVASCVLLQRARSRALFISVSISLSISLSISVSISLSHSLSSSISSSLLSLPARSDRLCGTIFFLQGGEELRGPGQIGQVRPQSSQVVDREHVLRSYTHTWPNWPSSAGSWTSKQSSCRFH